MRTTYLSFEHSLESSELLRSNSVEAEMVGNTIPHNLHAAMTQDMTQLHFNWCGFDDTGALPLDLSSRLKALVQHPACHRPSKKKLTHRLRLQEWPSRRSSSLRGVEGVFIGPNL